MSSIYRWQRTLDGWCLTHLEKTYFYPKVIKHEKYYKKCHKSGCENNVVNKKNRFYCAIHYKQLLEQVTPFSEPIVLILCLELE